MSNSSSQEEKRPDPIPHAFDDDSICTRCGFDGAEWIHWKRNTYEGRSSDLKAPSCK